MIYLHLFLGFLKVGLFAFGGAYGAIPLIREVVLANNWLTGEKITDMIAVSESTPGPIMVNLATYVGFSQAGIPGAAIATFAVILPSFFIILLVMFAFKSLLQNRFVKAFIDGMKPSITGIIIATGCYLTFVGLKGSGNTLDLRFAAVFAALALIYYLPQILFKKKLSPILFIIISAGAGILACGV